MSALEIGLMMFCTLQEPPVSSMPLRQTSLASFSYENIVFNGVNASPMTDYIGNLTTQIPYNSGTQCVFVALNIVLSYYDLCLNDNIINDGYESSVLASVSYDLHGNAMGINVSSLGSPGACESYDANNRKPGQQDLCTDGDMLAHVRSQRVQCALGLELGINLFWDVSSYVTWAPITSETEFYELLDDGYPIITNYGSGSDEHRVVAFNYEQDGNVLYHNGYPDGNPEEYPVFGVISYSLLNDSYLVCPLPTVFHVCSDGYVDNNGNPICPCLIPGNCLDVSHSHVDVKIDEYSHNSYCSGCATTMKNGHRHHRDPDSITPSSHLDICSCGDSLVHPHYPSGYTYSDIDYHLVTCTDGCEYLAEHDITYLYAGDYMHYMTCICGGWDYMPHFDWEYFYYDNSLYSMCKCGYSACPFATEDEAIEMYEYLLSLEEDDP